jgi:TolB protein
MLGWRAKALIISTVAGLLFVPTVEDPSSATTVRPVGQVGAAFRSHFDPQLSSALSILNGRRRGGMTSRVNVSSAGLQANSSTDGAALSGDGRYVAFPSYASNLVPNDTNSLIDVFVRDRRNKTTTRASVSSSGIEADGESLDPTISEDGRYVVFTSGASNLVNGDTNGVDDVFIRDLRTRTTTRVSLTSGGAESNGAVSQAAISADGRQVAFHSFASNLVPGDSNELGDVFVRHLQTGTTSRVSLTSSGTEVDNSSDAPAISGDGRYVAFVSHGTNLVPDGDFNGWEDIYVRDRVARTTTRVSVSSTGGDSDHRNLQPAINESGRYVVFSSFSSNLVPADANGVIDVFVRDLSTDSTNRVSLSSTDAEGNDGSGGAAISNDGRYVAFGTSATNLIPDDNNQFSDVLLRDLRTHVNSRVNLSNTGAEANQDSFGPAIAGNVLDIAFLSFASNLVRSDTNDLIDLFVRSG